MDMSGSRLEIRICHSQEHIKMYNLSNYVMELIILIIQKVHFKTLNDLVYGK